MCHRCMEIRGPTTATFWTETSRLLGGNNSQFPDVLTLNECTKLPHTKHPHSLILITVIILFDHFHKMHISFPCRHMKYHPSAVLFSHNQPLSLLLSCFLVKPFTDIGLITVFMTHQLSQSRRFKRGSNSNSPCGLICQPCETSGQRLVM